MPKVITRTARFDTYKNGAKIPADTKKGYRIDRSKPRDENDTLFCKKGETFYTWKFRYGGERRSKTYPRPSQLTQSDFLSRAYEIQESIGDFENWDSIEEIESLKDELYSSAEELRDGTQEKLDNMPEQLQYAPTGELLQERIDALEDFLSELDNIDTDEDADPEDARDILENLSIEVY